MIPAHVMHARHSRRTVDFFIVLVEARIVISSQHARPFISTYGVMGNNSIPRADISDLDHV